MHKGEISHLRSGAKLVYVSLPHMPIACASVWFRAGARFDPRGKEGLAHFFEHLLTARTKKYPSRNERLTALAERGIESNARTTFEAAYYYHFGPKKTLGESVDLLLGGVAETIFDTEDLEQERNAILDEESRNRSDSSQYLWRLSYAGLWPNSTLGSGFFGNDKTIQSISLADISDFYERYYQPKNAVFVVFGGAKERIRIYDTLNAFSWGKKKGAAKFPKEKFFDAKTVIVEPRKDGDRFWVSVGWRTIPDSEGKSEVIGEAVGGLFASGWISLLVNRLRIRENITYWVESDFANFSETGYMRFFFSIEKGCLQKGIRSVLEEVKRVKDGKITDDEFSKIRLSFLSGLSRRYLDIYELMVLYGWPAVSGRPIVSLDEYMKALNDLKKEDVEAFVRKNMSKENISVAIIGEMTPSQKKKTEKMIKDFSI
jgi:predicted Zn-dependent peptidase